MKKYFESRNPDTMKRENTQKVLYKTHKNLRKSFRKILLPLTGLLALIWILIRVIPKPQRATYPCMRLAFPFATSLIIYITGLLTSLVLFKNALRKASESRYLPAVFLFGAIV